MGQDNVSKVQIQTLQVQLWDQKHKELDVQIVLLINTVRITNVFKVQIQTLQVQLWEAIKMQVQLWEAIKMQVQLWVCEVRKEYDFNIIKFVINIFILYYYLNLIDRSL